MTAVLAALCSLLGNPPCDGDALRPAVAKEFLEDRYHFNIKAHLLTQRFASREYLNDPEQLCQRVLDLQTLVLDEIVTE